MPVHRSANQKADQLICFFYAPSWRFNCVASSTPATGTKTNQADVRDNAWPIVTVVLK